MSDDQFFNAAIKAGGTKLRVAISWGRELVADTTIPTTTPDETLGATIEFIRNWDEVGAAGIACFGPPRSRPDIAHRWLDSGHPGATLEQHPGAGQNPGRTWRFGDNRH